jgi:ankyrin repeat protein
LVIEDLIKAGAELNAADDRGRTPLHWAARKCVDEKVVAALLEAGGDARATDAQGRRPLDYAGKNEKLKGTAAYQALLDASN